MGEGWYDGCSIVSSQPLGSLVSFPEPSFHMSAVLLTCSCPWMCTGVRRWSHAFFFRLNLSPGAAPSPSGSGGDSPKEFCHTKHKLDLARNKSFSVSQPWPNPWLPNTVLPTALSPHSYPCWVDCRTCDTLPPRALSQLPRAPCWWLREEESTRFCCLCHVLHHPPSEWPPLAHGCYGDSSNIQTVSVGV